MPDWTWAAASRRGTAHEASGDGRQDAYRVLVVGRFVIAIACDGAGSTRHGRLGAVIAARMLSTQAAEWIRRHEAVPLPGTVEMWVAEARLEILVHADRRGCVMGEFASTLAMAISDGMSTVTAHVGDGAIVGRSAGSDSFTDLSWPESGQYASTTFFLTDEVLRLRIGLTSGIAIDRLAVLTDGLERLALNFAGKVVHPPFFGGMFAPFASIASCGRDRKLSEQLGDLPVVQPNQCAHRRRQDAGARHLPMTGPALFCAGARLQTGERIGRGGEGEVYAIVGDPAGAVKLYLKPDNAHQAKIRLMIAVRLAEKCTSVAFPQQLVYCDDGSFAGFTMQRVDGSQPIFELFATGSRRERFPRADWAFLVRTAANVARAVAQVHAAGAVIGDINSSGFLVSQRAIVTLIDADSFQVGSYRCRVGMPEYTPPELQNTHFGDIERTADHDAFGLAILVFQLLALGRHPYAGVRNGRGMPLETVITQGRFAYSRIRKVGSAPPPAALTLQNLPLGIRTLFELTFALRMGPRPTAAEWVGELTLLEAGLTRCLNNGAHVIPTLGMPCPWCRIEKQLGKPLFSSALAKSIPQPVLRTDLHYEVARVASLARDHAGETIEPMWRRSDVRPSKAATQLLPQDGATPAPLNAASRIGFVLTNHRSTRAFVERYNDTQVAAAQTLDLWRVDLGIWEINARAEKLRQDLLHLDRLKASSTILLAQATDRVVAGEAIKKMRSIPLGTARVPGIGAGLSAQLVRHGLATAADVTREHLERVPGLGEARSAALLLWRDRIMVEAQRNVAREPHLLQARIAAETASMEAAVASSEDVLRAQCVDLEHHVAKVLKRAWLIDQKVEAVLHDRDQAAMDLELLGIDKNTRLALSRNPTPSPPPVVAAKPKKKSKSAERQPVVCPNCGAPMVKRWANATQGSNKLFLGCSTYPRCTGSRPVSRKRVKP